MERVKKFFDTLFPKWDPKGCHPADYEGQLHKEPAKVGKELGEGLVLFDCQVTTNGMLRDGF